MESKEQWQISNERIAQLNAIGFEWKVRNSGKWEDKFNCLRAFQREHGHCRVPKSFMVESVKLGIWVHAQRQHYHNFMIDKTSALISDERIAQLNAIGFEWKVINTAAWQDKLKCL